MPDPAMTGSRKHASNRPSLRRRLLVFLLLPMLAIVVAVSVLAYVIALKFSNRTHDRDLSEELEGMSFMLRNTHSGSVLSEQAIFLIEYNPIGRNFFSIRSQHHGPLRDGIPTIPAGPTSSDIRHPALYDTAVHGIPVRAASVQFRSPVDPSDQLVVTLAETLTDRKLHAREILMMILPLQLLLTIVLLILVWHGVRYGLGILDPLTKRLAMRGHNLAPISDADVPAEILPLTETIDRLFDRIRALVELHERFISDAAHQLRTPLAGLSLHAERALNTSGADERRASLNYLRDLTLRTARISSQLLALTRAQLPLSGPTPLVRIDLARWLPDIIGARVHDATNADVDLGFDGIDSPVFIQGDAASLHELIDNLVDNAICYAGRSGTVTVGLRRDDGGNSACVSVDDDGPGVAADLQPRLGERFFRAPGAMPGGTGLGLAIVLRIAERHDARVVFGSSPLGGLCVEVHFPLKAQAS